MHFFQFLAHYNEHWQNWANFIEILYYLLINIYLSGNLAGHLAGAILRQESVTGPISRTTTQRPGAPTTSPPLRVFPRGQVQLERFPEGFNFNFKSD